MVIKTEGMLGRKIILEKFPPFNLLDKEKLYKIASSLREKNYPAGSYILKQGEASRNALFLIVRGKVEISVRDKYDKEIVTGYRNPLEFMGEAIFFTDKEYPASARAIESTRCFLLPQEVFEEILMENPDFSSFFTRILTERILIFYQRFYDEDKLARDEGFSKRISGIMVENVVTCSPGDNVTRIASLMRENNVSSVVVAEGDSPLGIITEGDLISKVLRHENMQKSIGCSAKELMSSNLITLRPEDFSYKAFLLMVKHRIKHVVVVDENGKLVGIVAIRDLLKSRKTGSFAIVNSIESRSTVEQIASLRPEIDQVLEALLVERATVLEINSLITEFYDRITRKIIEISEKEMIDEGSGAPPVGYCWITMGSSGRKEQFARTDQDNGILYEDVGEGKDEKEVKDYFLKLGEKVVAGLEQYGFKRCNGGVMGNSEDWCHSLQGWHNTIKNWTSFLDPKNVCLISIFLDFRYVYGEKTLYDLLRNFVTRNFHNDVLLQFLVKENLDKKVPISMFRQIQTERSGKHLHQINLKTSACIHVVDCSRVLALQAGLLEINTFERLQKLGEREVLKDKDVDRITAAYETLMMLRIRDAMTKMRRGIEPDNYIAPRDLTAREYSLLREALLITRNLQFIVSEILLVPR